MPTKAELMPCPFCSKEAEVIRDNYGYRIICQYCDVGLPSGGAYWEVDHAIKAWNTRHTPRCDQCKHWDQYAGFNLDTFESEGAINLGGCYQHTPVKTTEIGIQTEPDFHCAKFERRED